MKKVLLLSLAIFCNFLIPIQAQVTFQNVFGSESQGDHIPYDIIPTNDDGFAITGYSSAGTGIFQAALLTKTDAMGVPQWTKIFGGSNFEAGNAILQTPDNGFLIAGKSLSFGGLFEDAFLTKTDASGNLEWTKAYGGSHTDQANSVFMTNNGGFTFIGESRSFGPSDQSEVFMVNTDANGDVNWSKTHSAAFNVWRISGIALDNGGYAFTGMAEFQTPLLTQNEKSEEEILIENSILQNKPWLKKSAADAGGGGGLQTGILLVETDAGGNVVMEKMLGIAGTIDCFGTSIKVTQDGGYFIGGYTIEPTPFGFNYHTTAMKTNGNGDIQWTKNFQTFDSFYDVKVNQLENSTLTVTATKSLTPGSDSRIVNYFLTEGGGLIEAHEYGTTGLNAPRAAIPNSNGTLIAGQSNSFGMGTGFNPLKTYFVQTDGFGDSGCNDQLFIPLEASYTYTDLGIQFFTENNGTSHTPPNVNTEDLSLNNDLLCSFEPPVTGTVRGFVWWDQNKDGIQQADESGLGSIGVNLHNAADFSLIDNTFTEPDGTYSFEVTNTTFDYYVVFGTAPLFLETIAGAGNNEGLDSDITGNVGAGSTDSFSIEADGVVEVDGGLLGAGVASGFVWRDDNGDGSFVGEEDKGADGVQLLLIFNNSTFSNIPFTFESQNGGFFKFDNLLVGQATVEIADIQGTILEGGTLTTNNNPTAPFNINMNQLNVENLNFGFQVPLCGIEVLSAIAGDCNPDDNSYTVDVTVAYENAPDADIQIDMAGNSSTFAADGSGQQTFSIELTANGTQDVAVTASFVNEADCSDTLTAAFDSPEACDVNCMVEVLGVSVGDCSPATNSYTLEVTVEYVDAPDGILNIEVLGTAFPFNPNGSGQETFSILLPTTEAENVAVTASFVENPDCFNTLENAYNEPASCEPQCSIDITNIEVGDCNEDNNNYILEISVAYENAPDGDIIISLLGQDFDIPSNGSGEETYSLELPSVGVQNVEVMASFDNDSDCRTTMTDAYDEPEPCVNDCPTGVTATASDTEICSGESISVKALIDNLNFILIWTDENGQTFDVNNLVLTNETCAPIVRTFTAKVTCTTNSNMSYEDSIDVTVYPTDVSAFITPVEGGCTATVELDESCGDNLAIKPFEANVGDSGVGFVIVNWIGGGDCLDQLTIPVAYDCEGVIEAVDDNLGTFTIGESVTFNPSQILANDSGNNISLVEICTTSANGGTIVDNGNGTYTYTPPSASFVGTDTFCYQITDSDGNTDEGTVSVTYGDLKFVADVNYTCDEDEGTYTLILTIQGGASYLVEVLFPEEEAPFTMQQGVMSFGPFSIDQPNYSIKITQVNTGGSLTIDGVVIDCVTLPIELVAFEGEVLKEGNLLTWTTASELNNDFFSLQRSTNGLHFETIHTVNGAGTTSETNTYEYTDRDAPQGIVYYRLEQTDFDGSSTISKVIALQRGESKGELEIVSVTPLGNYQQTDVGFYSPSAGKVNVKVFDVSARLVYSTSIEAIEGFNTLQINTQTYSQGMYLLQLQHGETVRTVKILK